MIKRLPSKLLTFDENEVKLIGEKLKISTENLEEAVDLIVDWYKKQPHLPQTELPDLQRIVGTLLMARMSVEKAKAILDMQFTARTLFPEMYSFRNILKTDLKRISKSVSLITLKKISSKDLARVTIFPFRFVNSDATLVELLNYSFMIAEYRVYTDVSGCERFIIDMKNVTFSDLAIVTPVQLRKAEIINKQAYALHVAGIHIINAPSFVNSLVSVLKTVLKPKVAARIKVHPNLEDLYDYIDREILPKDYGGDDKTVDEISEAWRQELLSDFWRAKLYERDDLKTDESKRLEASPNDDLFGVDGSFRKLDID